MGAGEPGSRPARKAGGLDRGEGRGGSPGVRPWGGAQRERPGNGTGGKEEKR
jgi:hypothetical protein